jgi:hypothetical protein
MFGGNYLRSRGDQIFPARQLLTLCLCLGGGLIMLGLTELKENNFIVKKQAVKYNLINGGIHAAVNKKRSTA